MEEDDDKGLLSRLAERTQKVLNSAFNAYGSLFSGDIDGFKENVVEYNKINASDLKGDPEKPRPATGEKEAARVNALEAKLMMDRAMSPMGRLGLDTPNPLLTESLQQARAELREVCGEPEEVEPQKPAPATGEKEAEKVNALETELRMRRAMPSPMSQFGLNDHPLSQTGQLTERLQQAREELKEVCGEPEGMQLEEACGKSNALPSAATCGVGPVKRER